MKITVLTPTLDSEDENSKQYDPCVVPQVARALRGLGHRVSVLGVHGDVKRLISGLSRRRPQWSSISWRCSGTTSSVHPR